MLRKIIILIILSFFPLSCGYRFSGTGTLPSGVKKISITMLRNNTAESGMERIVTNEIIREFSRNGVVVVRNEGQADAVLSGVVVSVRTETIARSSVSTSSEKRIYTKLDMKLVNEKGRLLWAGRGIEENETYPVDSDNSSQRNQAIEDLVKRLSEKVYRRMTDNF